MAVKQDKRPFRLRHDKLKYQNESLFIQADLYNANFEFVNTPEVSIQLVDEKGNTFNYSFNKTLNNYSLELNQLMVGNYSYEAKVVLMEKNTFVKVNSQFYLLN